MENVYWTLQCTHRGIRTSISTGKREMRSNKLGCKAKIYATLGRDDRTKIIVKTLNESHNHELSPELYQRYVQQRKLTPSEKADAEELVRLNVPAKDLQRELVRTTGKRVIMKDVHNIKGTVRTKEKAVVPNGNDAQLMVHQIEEYRKMDPGLVAEVGTNDEGTLQYTYIQTSEMKATFGKFPEHVCIDCTYLVNDRDMPLLSFLVVDGNARSRLVAFALINNESSAMFQEIFTRFKVNNPQASNIKTFMVDKDLNEIANLERVFPNAFCEICLFHVKKAFKKKIDSLSCGNRSKMEIRMLVDRLCHASSVVTYEQLREELLQLHQPFSAYFLVNWDNMRERWAAYARSEHLNFGDATNNRIESYHQKLKTVIRSPVPLDVCFTKIMELYALFLEESNHVNFTSITKNSRTEFPELQRTITPHALNLAVTEVKKSSAYHILYYGEQTFAVHNNDINNSIEVKQDTCLCRTSLTLQIPCRHVIAVRRSQEQELLPLSLFAERWHINHNRSAPADSNSGSSLFSVFDWRRSAMSKKDRYGLVKPQIDRLLHLIVEHGEQRVKYYLKRLQDFEEMVSASKNFELMEEDVAQVVEEDVAQVVEEDVAQVVVEDVAQVVEEDVAQVVEEDVAQVVEEDVAQVVEEDVAQVVEEDVAQVVEEDVAQVVEEDVAQVVEEDVAQVVEEDVAQVVVEDVAQVVEEDVAQVVEEDVAQVVEEDVAQVVEEDVAQVVEEDVAQVVEEDVAQVVVEDVAQVVVEDVAQVVEEDVAQVVEEDVAQVVEEDVAQVVEEDVAQVVEEDVAQVVEEDVAQVVEEDVAQVVVEDVVRVVNVHQEVVQVVEENLAINNAVVVKPPSKLGKRGRPKGFGMTAIGLPKKRKILRNKCNECRLEDPLRELSRGMTEWVGCDRCERWFHTVCVFESDIGGDFVCKFCR